MTVAFELDGQQFIALNGGPEFTFDEAISFQVDCESQDEVDRYWNTLSEGGEEGPCGWLKDTFGLSWQIVPIVLDRAARRSGPGEGAAGDARDAEHEEDRDRRSPGSCGANVGVLALRRPAHRWVQAARWHSGGPLDRNERSCY
jgi:3-demethylubiquinone-9 3-methyltransferase